METRFSSDAELTALADQVDTQLTALRVGPAVLVMLRRLPDGERAELPAAPEQQAVIERATGEPFETFWQKYKPDFVSAAKLGENLHRHQVALVILSAGQSAAVAESHSFPQRGRGGAWSPAFTDCVKTPAPPKSPTHRRCHLASGACLLLGRVISTPVSKSKIVFLEFSHSLFRWFGRSSLGQSRRGTG